MVKTTSVNDENEGTEKAPTHKIVNCSTLIGHDVNVVLVDEWDCWQGFGMTTVVQESSNGILRRNGMCYNFIF
jgi:hypothetical protein